MSFLFEGKCSRFGCGTIIKEDLPAASNNYEWRICPQCSLHVALTYGGRHLTKEPPRCADCTHPLTYSPKRKRYFCYPCASKRS